MNAEWQLQAIRERWSGARWEDWYSSDWDEQSQNDGILRYAPTDIVALLRMISERDAIIHDLQQDGEAMHERIRQAERREVVNCLHYLLQRKRKQRKAVDLFDIETQIIGCRGLVGNPLPPDQARAEADRLRGVLADLVSGCGSHSCKVKRPAGVGVNGPCRCVDKLVQLVEE